METAISVPVQVYLIGDGQRKNDPDEDIISFIRVGCEDRLEEVL